MHPPEAFGSNLGSLGIAFFIHADCGFAGQQQNIASLESGHDQSCPPRMQNVSQGVEVAIIHTYGEGRLSVAPAAPSGVEALSCSPWESRGAERRQ